MDIERPGVSPSCIRSKVNVIHSVFLFISAFIISFNYKNDLFYFNVSRKWEISFIKEHPWCRFIDNNLYLIKTNGRFTYKFVFEENDNLRQVGGVITPFPTYLFTIFNHEYYAFYVIENSNIYDFQLNLNIEPSASSRLNILNIE